MPDSPLQVSAARNGAATQVQRSDLRKCWLRSPELPGICNLRAANRQLEVLSGTILRHDAGASKSSFLKGAVSSKRRAGIVDASNRRMLNVTVTEADPNRPGLARVIRRKGTLERV